MTTISHQPPTAVRAPWWIEARNLWTSLAIIAIWLAVTFTAIFGPDITSSTVGGTNTSTPSAVAVAFFAVFATWVVAKYGFERRPKDS